MDQRRRVVAAIAALLTLSACTGGGATQGGDLLDTVKAAGQIRVGTDPNYAPSRS